MDRREEDELCCFFDDKSDFFFASSFSIVALGHIFFFLLLHLFLAPPPPLLLPLPSHTMTSSSKNKAPADAQSDLFSVRLFPLLAEEIKEGDGATLSVEFPSVPGDKEKVDEEGNKVYEEAIFHGGFERGDRLPLEVASRLGSPSFSIKGVGGERGSPVGSAPSSVFAVACVDPDAPGGVGGSNANGERGF